MKKLLSIILAALLLISLFACGKNKDEPKGTESESDTSEVTSDTASDDVTTDDDTTEDDTTEDDTTEETDTEVTTDTDDTTDTEVTTEDSDTTEDDDKEESKTVTLDLNKNTKGIKLLGVRNLLSDSYICCDHSGSGIEFVLQNEGSSMELEMVSSGPCRFKIFVNGEVVVSSYNEDFFEIFGESTIELTELPLGNITVRVVKITEPSLAIVELTKMTFTGTLSDTAPKDKDMYIEFIGGDAMVGSGATEGYEDQDVTKAYSYLLAEAMNADYSITSIDTVLATKKVKDAVAMYELASPKRDSAAKYGFTRKADVVVVDLGALDAELSATDTTITVEAFSEKYEELLTAIRAKNGEDCKIICVHTTAMGNFVTAVSTVCRQNMGGQQEGVYLCQRGTGGTAFSNTLKTTVEAAINGVITEKELSAGESGEGIKVDINNDFVIVKASGN